MGCCLLALLLAGAPRLAFLLWWLFQPLRMEATFDTFIWPLLGILFLPWTTIMYVAVFPGGVGGFDWVLVGLGLAVDLATYAGNARAKQQQNIKRDAQASIAAPPTQAEPVTPPPAEPQAPAAPTEPTDTE